MGFGQTVKMTKFVQLVVGGEVVCTLYFLTVLVVRVVVNMCIRSAFIHPCINSVLMIMLVCYFVQIFIPQSLH